MRSLKALLAALLLGMCIPALAAAMPERDPVDLVETTADRVLSELRENPERTRENPEFLFDLVDEIILPLIDFEGMSRLILARHWRTATPEQRERFTEAFRDMLVRTYTRQMAEHMDKDIRVLPHRSFRDERMALVATEIVMGQGESNIPVNYRLRPVDGHWKVFDLEVDGLSFVTNFRTAFGAEVEKEGLDALIRRLEEGDKALVEEAVETGGAS